ncbi:MAG TPA: efflux RND transporter periplasmic adaptor subunit [Gemmataceae bacterium]|nr:efflux RND transporter periplasmic adaptor subunit [Gemmataceae bacterium]
MWVVVLTVALGGVAAAAPFVMPTVQQWLARPAEKEAEKKEKDTSHELVLDAKGRPVDPPTIRLSAEAAKTLNITPETTVKAREAREPRPLPPLEGNLAYESDGLFAVRPRFGGEVVEIAPPREKDREPPLAESAKQPNRPLGFGDRVTKGQLLAIVWSKDLGDKKAALIDAMIDLRRDEQRWQRLKKGFESALIAETTVLDAERTVEKDKSAVNAAERTLRMWKLNDKEIDALKREAATILQSKRDPKKEQDWAKVEVKAPHDGVIVEKNTNVGDWVDPVNGNPMFRIADLRTLGVWVTAPEERLPVLLKMMKKPAAQQLTWRIRLHSEPDSKPLEGPVLRIAPSVDPLTHTLLVIGRVANPQERLLVGQFITATIYVPPDKDLVEIPTNALNEENGQSLVFVQPDPAKLEFQVRRVAVKDRFKEMVLVRSQVTEQAAPKATSLRGPWLIRALAPGERVVTQGVPMLTVALRDLLAREDNSSVNK